MFSTRGLRRVDRTENETTSADRIAIQMSPSSIRSQCLETIVATRITPQIQGRIYNRNCISLHFSLNSLRQCGTSPYAAILGVVSEALSLGAGSARQGFGRHGITNNSPTVYTTIVASALSYTYPPVPRYTRHHRLHYFEALDRLFCRPCRAVRLFSGLGKASTCLLQRTNV